MHHTENTERPLIPSKKATFLHLYSLFQNVMEALPSLLTISGPLWTAGAKMSALLEKVNTKRQELQDRLEQPGIPPLLHMVSCPNFSVHNSFFTNNAHTITVCQHDNSGMCRIGRNHSPGETSTTSLSNSGKETGKMHAKKSYKQCHRAKKECYVYRSWMNPERRNALSRSAVESSHPEWAIDATISLWRTRQLNWLAGAREDSSSK